MNALLSIHDVMPETLERVISLIARIPAHCRQHLLLLIVPGRHWQAADLDQLRAWQAQGFILAGHGWHHQARHIGSVYHRLHAALISRRAGEHLALDAEATVELMQRNFDWFVEHGLVPPDYYVPPAWALGSIPGTMLSATPFRYLETLSGILDIRQNRFRRLPLAGFEADTPFRQYSLSLWNRLNRTLSSDRRPLRLGIHPNDAGLRLAGAMDDMLARVSRGMHYRDLF